MEVIQKLFPEAKLFDDENAKKPLFDEVMGTASVRQRILAGDSAEAIVADWKPEMDEFMKIRAKYLYYE
jgi:uncharacterized protein YbbC (DUF1343 family)